MTEKKKRTYEPPRVSDLSGSGASGEVLGSCFDGNTPYSACSSGDIFQPGDTCSPGTYPTVGTNCRGGFTPLGNCRGGPYPGGPRCRPTGSNATLICYTGTQA